MEVSEVSYACHAFEQGRIQPMTERNSTGSRWPSSVIGAGFAVAVVLYCYVVIRWPDNFFADDSYFYFQVAWNIARGFGSTFNNVMPTNGYHPLWMLVCVTVFKIFPAKSAAVHGIGAMISLLDAGALVLLWRILGRVAPGFWWIAILAYAPFCFLTQLGTEGALSGFFLAALVLATYKLCEAPSGAKGFIFALCGALAVLSRLDNIFIVSLIFLACYIAAPANVRAQVRRTLLLCIPVYVVLWGAYVGSNLHWFGTIQPISGMLKAHPHGEVRHFSKPPHIALLGFGTVIAGTLILARISRDTFFRVVELPFAIGVVFHAAYITFVMSSETRWSWYYTSWVLLSAILVSRIVFFALAKRGEALRIGLAATALVLLFYVWLLGDRRFGHTIDVSTQSGFEEVKSVPLHTAIAYDKPGRLAFYSDVRIVAIDGLMGDISFQHELATKGIAEFDARNHVDAFVGPTQPLDEYERKVMCEQVYLSSMRFHCVATGPGAWTVDGVEIFARLTGASAGSLALPRKNLLTNNPIVAIWRLPAGPDEQHEEQVQAPAVRP